jgi:hypothetical protein
MRDSGSENVLRYAPKAWNSGPPIDRFAHTCQTEQVNPDIWGLSSKAADR